ncbi:hypothetical protein SALBM311S_07058 [Streptomyces alboniger]
MYAARDDLKGRAKNLGNQAGDSDGELKSRMAATAADPARTATEMRPTRRTATP